MSNLKLLSPSLTITEGEKAWSEDWAWLVFSLLAIDVPDLAWRAVMRQLWPYATEGVMVPCRTAPGLPLMCGTSEDIAVCVWSVWFSWRGIQIPLACVSLKTTVLRYNWHTTLYQLYLCNVIIWYLHRLQKDHHNKSREHLSPHIVTEFFFLWCKLLRSTLLAPFKYAIEYR